MAQEWPTGIGTQDAQSAASAVSNLTVRLRTQTTAFRTAISNSTVNSQVVQDYYNVLAEARNYIESVKNIPGLKEAILVKYPTAVGFDPAVSWPLMQTAIVNIAVWLQSNLEKTAGGRPTFQEYEPVTGNLKTFEIPVTGTARTNLLALLDALLLRFS